MNKTLGYIFILLLFIQATCKNDKPPVKTPAEKQSVYSDVVIDTVENIEEEVNSNIIVDTKIIIKQIVYSSVVIDTNTTIKKGFELLGDKDTLYVKQSIRNENLINVIPSNKYLCTYKNDSVIIKPRSGQFVLDIRRREKIKISGKFIFDGTNISNVIAKVTDSSRNITFDGVELRNGKSQGLLTTSGADHVTFENGYIHDIGIDKNDHGFYSSSSNSVLRNTKVTRISGRGFLAYINGKNRINKNLVEYNDISYTGKNGGAILFTKGSGHISRYNYIHDNENGNMAKYDAVNPQFYGNTYKNNYLAFWALNIKGLDSTYVESGAKFTNNRHNYHIEN